MAVPVSGETVALWLFDEPQGAYPSTILNDAGPNRYVLALGRGGKMVEGRFGNALTACEIAPLAMAGKLVALGRLEAAIAEVDFAERSPSRHFGLVPLPTPAGRTVAPLTWYNAAFSALATSGEKHLRSGGFANVTDTKLNLGDFDWTVEFWYAPSGDAEGVILEVGAGPRGENDRTTQLLVAPAEAAFRFRNQPGNLELTIPTDRRALESGWHHWAFVYDSKEGTLRHFVDGRSQGAPVTGRPSALPHGDEAYLTIGRDARWQKPLAGAIDELRISDHQVYRESFSPPESFSVTYSGRLGKSELPAGPPLLFTQDTPNPIPLGGRKHLFLDDALVEKAENVSFTVNPPKQVARAIDNVKGHLTVVDDEQGLLRLFYQGPEDSLAVLTSRDGVSWTKPDLGREIHGERNIVCDRAVGLGVVFIDSGAPAGQRWKYLSGIRRQGVFVFTSADGWWFEPHETAALPFSAGSQSALYYDDQRQLFVAHHRSDYGATPLGSTQRRFVMSEVKDLLRPWPFEPATPERTRAASKRMRTHADIVDPWFLDNGPLAPSGFGIELPTVFAHDEHLDPEGTDIYVTKAQKYPWAPDAYVAFPTMYFHYWDAGPRTRQVLGTKERGRGSGVTEVQLATSRDGLTWRRFPRPAYAPIGGNGRNDVHMLFMAHGMARRGDEIWQFVTGHGGNGIGYHSAWNRGAPSPLWKLVQRLDGFVAAEGDYRGGLLTTKPLTFAGSRLHLNIDTGATGYVQVGLMDRDGKYFAGYGLDECVYINGDFLDTEVEWVEKGTDVSALAGRPVKIVFRLPGSKLFAIQFK